jgi:hypothetical protein
MHHTDIEDQRTYVYACELLTGEPTSNEADEVLARAYQSLQKC